jgi:hypothetical protein
MLRCTLVCVTVSFALFARIILAQQMVIAHPEAIAGRWETADRIGGIVGMNIIVETHIEGQLRDQSDEWRPYMGRPPASGSLSPKCIRSQDQHGTGLARNRPVCKSLIVRLAK